MSNKHITATGIHDYLKEHVLLLILLFFIKTQCITMHAITMHLVISSQNHDISGMGKREAWKKEGKPATYSPLAVLKSPQLSEGLWNSC